MSTTKVAPGLGDEKPLNPRRAGHAGKDAGEILKHVDQRRAQEDDVRKRGEDGADAERRRRKGERDDGRQGKGREAKGGGEDHEHAEAVADPELAHAQALDQIRHGAGDARDLVELHVGDGVGRQPDPVLDPAHPLVLPLADEGQDPGEQGAADGYDDEGGDKGRADLVVQEPAAHRNLDRVGPELVSRLGAVEHPVDVGAHEGQGSRVIRRGQLHLGGLAIHGGTQAAPDHGEGLLSVVAVKGVRDGDARVDEEHGADQAVADAVRGPGLGHLEELEGRVDEEGLAELEGDEGDARGDGVEERAREGSTQVFQQARVGLTGVLVGSHLAREPAIEFPSSHTFIKGVQIVNLHDTSIPSQEQLVQPGVNPEAENTARFLGAVLFCVPVNPSRLWDGLEAQDNQLDGDGGGKEARLDGLTRAGDGEPSRAGLDYVQEQGQEDVHGEQS